MHIEPRLLVFTQGVRARIAATVAVGLLGVAFGVARLGLLGWLIGQIFAGRPAGDLALPVALIALVMVLRGGAEHWRAVLAHETAARVQKRLRRILYDKVAELGPGTVGRQRSGGLTLSILVIPIVIITTAEALRAVPDSIREAGFGVGATRWEVIRSQDRKSTRLNSSHSQQSRMPSSA